MSVSAIFGTRILPVTASTPQKSCPRGATELGTRVGRGCSSGSGTAVIECSSRPQKKATAHHRKTRPRKSQPWDIRRGPTVYPPLPPLPAEWTLVAAGSDTGEDALEAPPPSIPDVSE